MKTLTDFTAESGCTCRVRARRQKKKIKNVPRGNTPPGALFPVMMYLGGKKKKNTKEQERSVKAMLRFLHVQHVHGLLHVHGSKGPRADYAYVCMHVHARRISSDIGVRRAVYVCAWLYV